RRQVEQKLEIHQQQLRTLASQLSLTEQRERWKIATGLHDRVGQNLAFSLLKLQSVHQGEHRADLKKTLGGVCGYIKKSIQEIRTLIFDLGSPILYQDGFEPALKDWLTEHIEKVHGIACEYRDDGQPKPLDDDIMVLLFDSVREVLVNVVKHAGAKKIKVNIYRDDDNMEIIVEDDGIGFDTAAAGITPGRSGGFGLFSIRERLDYIHGRFEIKSGHGRGTKITLRVPLKNA
ncbi:MAG: sensor histidine kinase, partial [Sedimentisphaerales bacterium]|nr:sensor histidine kinase [Sedimentisphaerales bacterium]